jgi:hypothetical protein
MAGFDEAVDHGRDDSCKTNMADFDEAVVPWL